MYGSFIYPIFWADYSIRLSKWGQTKDYLTVNWLRILLLMQFYPNLLEIWVLCGRNIFHISF